jgi:hypothetical protein
MMDTNATPTNLGDWKRRFRALIEQARLSELNAIERAALIVAIRRDADLIAEPIPERDDPWGSIGYRRGGEQAES